MSREMIQVMIVVINMEMIMVMMLMIMILVKLMIWRWQYHGEDFVYGPGDNHGDDHGRDHGEDHDDDDGGDTRQYQSTPATKNETNGPRAVTVGGGALYLFVKLCDIQCISK